MSPLGTEAMCECTFKTPEFDAPGRYPEVTRIYCVACRKLKGFFNPARS